MDDNSKEKSNNENSIEEYILFFKDQYDKSVDREKNIENKATLIWGFLTFFIINFDKNSQNNPYLDYINITLLISFLLCLYLLYRVFSLQEEKSPKTSTFIYQKICKLSKENQQEKIFNFYKELIEIRKERTEKKIIFFNHFLFLVLICVILKLIIIIM